MRWARVVMGCLVAAGAIGADASPAFAHDLGGRRPTNVRSRVVRIDPRVCPAWTCAWSSSEDGWRSRTGRTRRSSCSATRASRTCGWGPTAYSRTVWHRRCSRTAPRMRRRTSPTGTTRRRRRNGTASRGAEPCAGTTIARTTWDPATPPASARTREPNDLRTTPRSSVNGRSTCSSTAARWRCTASWPGSPLPRGGHGRSSRSGVAAAVVLAARRRWRATVGTTLALLIAAGVVHVAGGWTGAANGLAARAGAAVIPAFGFVLAGVALGRASSGGTRTRRRHGRSSPRSCSRSGSVSATCWISCARSSRPRCPRRSRARWSLSRSAAASVLRSRPRPGCGPAKARLIPSPASPGPP